MHYVLGVDNNCNCELTKIVLIIIWLALELG